MTIINTSRNTVYAYEQQPEDVLVQVGWTAPGDDGLHRRTITMPCWPISEYQAAVEWAVSMADMMVYPLYVVPLSHNDIFRTERWEPYREFIAGMNDQERGELRRTVVTTCCEVMRDCDDSEIRADMFHVLRQLKVVRHES